MRGVIISSAVMLASCATLEPAVEPVVSKTDPVLSMQDHLSPVKLLPGECGLFIWTADADKRFILFSQSREASGRWHINGGTQSLSIHSEDGIFVHGQYAQTRFKTAEAEEVMLGLGDAETISDGTRFKSGVLKHISVEGWERITPVVGLAACQPGV